MSPNGDTGHELLEQSKSPQLASQVHIPVSWLQVPWPEQEEFVEVGQAFGTKLQALSELPLM